MKFFVLLALPLFLTGCISFHSSETPAPVYVDACANKESQCREICGNTGVQAFSCSARPGEGIHLKCECRKSGQAL
ncbi:MAG: hypothetical protein FD187_1190 [bacterium]|nr:MAG: hypothetical protein FD142_462 [bacterium]KAF0149263.1 MAG: hypothetical protein FD187_1190 [bacterium]KAF0169785.1 MAG: hypothetical protein FD158_172 [bacterium]TXT22709.1 MAG: hypothetical protein FD132_270 [bacterium]